MPRLRVLDGASDWPVGCVLWAVVYAGFHCLNTTALCTLVGGVGPLAIVRLLTNGILGVVLGFALIGWTLLRVLGRVSEASAGGLFLAAVGLLLRAWTEFLVGYVDAVAQNPNWASPNVANLTFAFRSTGTLAYGVGLAFAVGACWADLRMRTVPGTFVPSFPPGGGRAVRAARLKGP